MSIAHPSETDRLEVHTGEAVARCVVVADSPSYRHGLAAALRESGLVAEETADPANVAPGLQGTERLVVLMATDSTAAPPAGAQEPGIIAVALLPDAASASYTQALRRGWSAAVHRDAPLELILEVVGEALRGRTLLPGDVARTLAGGPSGDDPLAPARDAIERRRFDFAAAGIGVGDPESELTPVPGTGGCEQVFTDAWMLWHPSTGAFALRRSGPIAGRYTSRGGPTGALGYPVMDETPVAGGAICRFQARGAALVAGADGEVRQTAGVLGEYWMDTLGGPAGPWGFPVTDEYAAAGGGRALDFTGGTLVWREHSGVTEFPTRELERDVAAWLSMLPDAPVRTSRGGFGRATGVRESADSGATTFVYSDPALLHTRQPDDPGLAGICHEIDRRRELIGPVRGLRPAEVGYTYTGTPVDLTTTVAAETITRLTGAMLGPAITPTHYRQALVDVWHDLFGTRFDVAAIDTSTDLSWGGVAPDGGLQRLVRALFARSRDARRLLLQVGMSVQKVDGRAVFVAVDTARAWRLYGRDAERYIRCDRRLLSLLIRIAEGTVPDALLPGEGDHAERNAALRQAVVDAHFVTVATGVGRLPGWSLAGSWTRELRAAVAHNLLLGCLNGWAPYRRTGGHPAEIVRAMAWDFFCGPAALLAQSAERFEGAAGHDALQAAARSFPGLEDDDDGEARYIVAGRQRRRIDRADSSH